MRSATDLVRQSAFHRFPPADALSYMHSRAKELEELSEERGLGHVLMTIAMLQTEN
jgi:hypothetical protein